MLEAYSSNVTVEQDSNVPFNSVSMNKGCDEVLSSSDTIQLNKKGVYQVTFCGSASAAATVQLFKNGVAQSQAISTGTNPVINTLIQVSESNCGCYCKSPVMVQIKNTGSASATFTSCNLVARKLPCGG